MTKALHIALFLAVGLALYPLISIGGWMEQSFGIWWALAIPAAPLAMAAYHYSLRLRPRGGA
jgi:hypothetical protein